MTGNRSELLPCPFCGGDKARSMFDTRVKDVPHVVLCGLCGARGSHAKSADQAIAAWNTRTPNQPLSDSVVERARPLLDCTAKSNRPIGHGERIVGFKLPEDVAGLSDGLFMLDALVELAKRGAAIAAIPAAGGVEEMREALRDALDMVVDAARDGTYSVSRFKALRDALGGGQ